MDELSAMTATAESLKNSLESVFTRKGANGVYTRLFESLESEQRFTLLSALKLREAELPIIGSLRGKNDWLVLTTERLIWAIAGVRQVLDANAIRDATADFKTLQASGNTKLEMESLQVTTLSGAKYTIFLEPGQPLSGVWNVLKNLGARNRSAPERTITRP
jgi:hypothetical protein